MLMCTVRGLIVKVEVELMRQVKNTLRPIKCDYLVLKKFYPNLVDS